VVEQNTTEGAARTMFCGTQNARTWHIAVTVCYVQVFEIGLEIIVNRE